MLFLNNKYLEIFGRIIKENTFFQKKLFIFHTTLITIALLNKNPSHGRLKAFLLNKMSHVPRSFDA